MARASKCDRCGKFYEQNKMHPTRRVKSDRVITSVVFRDSLGYYDQCFDLCDECITELYAFMQKRGER